MRESCRSKFKYQLLRGDILQIIDLQLRSDTSHEKKKEKKSEKRLGGNKGEQGSGRRGAFERVDKVIRTLFWI